MLIKHLQAVSEKPLQYVIVGTDVNRDNGLCAILRNSAAKMKVRHIDVFDSRVYPSHDESDISKEFHQHGKDVGENIKLWREG